MKAVVITGVSTGIGRHAAGYLVDRGYRVYGSVRSNQQAMLLQKELGESFKALSFDITDEGAVRRGAEAVRSDLGTTNLAGLICNAGISATGPLLHVPVEKVQQLLDVNVLGQINVIQAFGPLLGMSTSAALPRGRLVLISSVSGRVSFPLSGPYCISKHALEAMGDTLRRELSLYGIPVSIIEPGNVKSAIWFKLEKKSPYAGTDFGSAHQALLDSARAAGPSRGSDPLPISEAIYHALTATKPRKRYLMPGSSLRAQVRTVYAPELVPGWWGDRKMSIRNDG